MRRRESSPARPPLGAALSGSRLLLHSEWKLCLFLPHLVLSRTYGSLSVSHPGWLLPPSFQTPIPLHPVPLSHLRSPHAPPANSGRLMQEEEEEEGGRGKGKEYSKYMQGGEEEENREGRRKHIKKVDVRGGEMEVDEYSRRGGREKTRACEVGWWEERRERRETGTAEFKSVRSKPRGNENRNKDVWRTRTPGNDCSMRLSFDAFVQSWRWKME